ncbi:HEAT repeat domain-containing protein [Synechococcus sp. PCC 7336]|uniref:HEAT repeat domain-containing protein n=1 Tax=Synechococcus sp. PCC 7336 TaxID=195250 RepID=UPI00034A76A7|nr:HEAT repeat domain-containing protein [Synechococcus sp. PCC 7336]
MNKPASSQIAIDEPEEDRFAISNFSPELETVIHGLKWGEFQVRWDAAKKLPHCGPAALPALLQLLRDPEADEELLWFGARALGQFDRPEAIAALADLLDAGEDEDVVAAAAAGIASFGTVAIPPLQSLLADESKRLSAVRALAYIRSVEAVPPLLSVLEDRGATVREAALNALASLPETPESLAAAISALCDPASGVRQAAVTGLSAWLPRHPEIDWLSYLQPLLVDLNSQVAIAAAIAVGRVGSEAAANALRALCRDSLAPESLRLAAVRSLGWIATPIALAHLRDCLMESSASLQLTCIRVLGRVEVPLLKIGAAGALTDWLQQQAIAAVDPPALQAIAHSLGQLGQFDSFTSLVQLLSCQHMGVRLHAIAALQQLDRVRSRQQLVAIAQQRDLAPQLARGIAIALAEWE